MHLLDTPMDLLEATATDHPCKLDTPMEQLDTPTEQLDTSTEQLDTPTELLDSAMELLDIATNPTDKNLPTELPRGSPCHSACG